MSGSPLFENQVVAKIGEVDVTMFDDGYLHYVSFNVDLVHIHQPSPSARKLWSPQVLVELEAELAVPGDTVNIDLDRFWFFDLFLPTFFVFELVTKLY